MRPAQRGASGLFIAILLILVAVGALAILALSRGTGQVERGAQVSDRFRTLQDALAQFVAANGRLPCPANPAANTGDAVPDAATVTCTHPAGTVPWKTIGVRPEDALDSWGGKISYRAYTGPAGSLTQTNGASMVNCDLDETLPAGKTPPTAVPGEAGLCRAAQDTTEGQFLAGKGFTVNNFGTATDKVAYVLISHGPSGLGAYTTADVQKPLPVSADELANLGQAGPFIAKASSAQDVGPDAAGHFDDLVAYLDTGELIRKAGQGGRKWPEPGGGFANVRLDNPTVAAALEQTGTVSYGDLGRATVNFQNAQVTGFDSGGNQNISFDISGSTEGFGVGGGSLSSLGSEGFRIAFGQKAGKLAFTATDLGIGERVNITFYDGVTSLGTVSKDGCNPDDPAVSGELASFSIDSVAAFGFEFDNLEMRPVLVLVDTEFFLSEFKTCAAADPTCATSLATLANTCP